MMRKIAAIASALFAYLSFAPYAFAASISVCPPGGTSFSALCNQDSSHFGTIIGSLITLAFILAIVVALAFLIYGGIKWILSEGDKTKVEESRNHVIAAVIGLIVVFLSYFILNLVIGFFAPNTNLGTLTLPTINGGAAPAPSCAAGQVLNPQTGACN